MQNKKSRVESNHVFFCIPVSVLDICAEDEISVFNRISVISRYTETKYDILTISIGYVTITLATLSSE